MKLNASTGELVLRGGLGLSPDLSRSQFLASPAGLRSGILVRNEPWCSFCLNETDRDVAVAISFKSELLLSVQVSVVDPRFGTGWHDWSHKKEMQRKAANDRWLLARGLAPGKQYAWGCVWSGFDPNSCFSSAVVRYSTES